MRAHSLVSGSARNRLCSISFCFICCPGWRAEFGVTMKLTKRKREELRMKFGGRCAFCGTGLPARGWHAEKIETEILSDDLIPVCGECSSSKGNASTEAFRALLSKQVARAQRHSVNFRTALRFGLVSETASPVVFWFERYALKTSPATRSSVASYSQSAPA